MYKKSLFYIFILCLLSSTHTEPISPSFGDSFGEVSRVDCLALGTAVYDMYFHLDQPSFESFCQKFSLAQGADNEIDEKMIEYLMCYHDLCVKEHAGGSTANVAAGIVALGGAAAFAGTIGDDMYGKKFVDDLGAVHNQCFVADSHKKTGRVFIIITDDGKRTLLSCPGVADNAFMLEESINKPSIIGRYRVVLTDGFLLRNNALENQSTIKNIFAMAHACNAISAFSLAATCIIENRRPLIMELLPQVDILFGNFDEMALLFKTDSLDRIVTVLAQSVKIGVITCGAAGAWIVHNNKCTYIPACDVPVVDSTGAGDMFAAGFLYGLTHGYSIEKSGLLGSRLAGYIVQKAGARPEQSLSLVTLPNLLL